MKIWSDPVIENLPANARYLFIYLITCPSRNESALFNITQKRIANDTGLNIKQVGNSLAVLCDAGRIMYDFDTSTVWVINAVKHQAMNDNCKKSILNDLARCSSSSLATAFASFYSGFKGLETHADGLPNPSIGLEIGLEIGLDTRDRVQGEEKEKEVKIADDKPRPESLDEVKKFFKESGSSEKEAEKFWNHFEANGWKVGGRSPMKKWKAAAKGWILRSGEFSPEEAKPQRSKAVERFLRKPECGICGGDHQDMYCPTHENKMGSPVALQVIKEIKEMTKGFGAFDAKVDPNEKFRCKKCNQIHAPNFICEEMTKGMKA